MEEKESMDISNVISTNNWDVSSGVRPSDKAERAQAITGAGPNSHTNVPVLDVVNDQLLTGEAHIDATTIELRYDPPIHGVDVRA